jgi:hypothetical protein
MVVIYVRCQWTYPVDFVEVVGFQDPGADDAGAVGRAHLDVDMAEEDVEVTLNCGSVTLLGNGELGTEVGACHGAGGGAPASQRSRSEVGVETVLFQTGVRRASLCKALVCSCMFGSYTYS